MKLTKKVLVLIMALVMLCCIALPAFAAPMDISMRMFFVDPEGRELPERTRQITYNFGLDKTRTFMFDLPTIPGFEFYRTELGRYEDGKVLVEKTWTDGNPTLIDFNVVYARIGTIPQEPAQPTAPASTEAPTLFAAPNPVFPQFLSSGATAIYPPIVPITTDNTNNTADNTNNNNDLNLTEEEKLGK